LKQPANSDSSIITWIRETSIRNIHLIQGLFCAANIGATFYAAGKLVSLAGTDFYFNERLHVISSEWVGKSLFLTVVPGLIFAIGRQLISYLSSHTPVVEHTLSFPIIDLDSGESLIDPDTGDPAMIDFKAVQSPVFRMGQIVNQAVHISQMAMDCGLILLSKDRWVYIAHALTTLFNFYKNTSLKWSAFSFSDDTRKMTSYHLTFEEDLNAEVSTCPKHMGSAAQSAKKLVQSVLLVGDRDISYSPSRKIFEMRIDRSEFPKCSSCDEPLTDIKYERWPWNREISICTPSISASEENEAFFAKLEAVWDVFKLGIGCLGLYPQLSVLSANIQIVTAAFDEVLFNQSKTHALSQIIRDRIDASSAIPNHYRGASVNKIHVISASVIFGLSCLLTLGINRLLRPSISASEWLSSSSIPPEGLKGVALNWSIPALFFLTQAVHVARIITLIAHQVFASQYQWPHAISIGAVVTNLVHFSKLRWVECVKTMEYPIKVLNAMNAGISTYYMNEHSLKDFTLSALFVMPMPIVPKKEQIEAFFKSSYELIQSCLDKSQWERFWFKGNICYRTYFLAESFFKSGLFLLSLTGVDRTYGTAWFHKRAH
ncbi:MAG: hypothetical protein K9M07_07315, partial [Simkaniaceae bacterium]|nr:hypothetical protein [Simkaniaceae bacterium]MCF7853030.1 hypothetical protein [Simkaniaceae bacterium]